MQQLNIKFIFDDDSKTIICLDENNNILKYEEWEKLRINISRSYRTNIHNDEKHYKIIELPRISEKELNEIRELLNLKKKKDKKRTYKKEGFIYLLKDKDDNYKIGMTTKLSQRIDSFKSYPNNIQLVYYFKSENIRADEDLLHSRFSDRRVKGEWFKLTEDDINWIKSIKSSIDLQVELALL